MDISEAVMKDVWSANHWLWHMGKDVRQKNKAQGHLT